VGMKSPRERETERNGPLAEGSSGLTVQIPSRLQKGAGDRTKWMLVVGPRSLNTALLTAIARLGEGGPVRVLDGGNRFNAYVVARAARGQPEVLNRITVSRAFTCYQVLSLLESTPAIQVSPAPPARGTDQQAPLRLVALDLLNTFYDESVRVGERLRLLQACILHLERLAGTGGNAISVHPPAVASQTAIDLLETLQRSAAVEPYFIQTEARETESPRLF
jgi:hypothetical protein